MDGGDAGDTGGQAAKMGVVGSSGDDGRCRTQGAWMTGDEIGDGKARGAEAEDQKKVS